MSDNVAAGLRGIAASLDRIAEGLNGVAQAINNACPYPMDLSIGKPLMELAEAVADCRVEGATVYVERGGGA